MTPNLRFPEFTDEWQAKRILDLGTVVTGTTPNTSDRTLYGDEFDFVSPGDMNSGRYVTRTKQKLSRKGYQKVRQIPAGSTLFVCIGSTIGKTAQTISDCATNQQINAVTPNGQYNNDFVYLTLSRSSCRIASMAGKQAVPIISKGDFQKSRVYTPAKGEQEKIADFLTTVDERIDSQEKRVELLNRYKKGVMQKIFTQQIRFKDENDETYPAWQEKKLGELADIKSGSSKSEHIDANGSNVIVDMGAISSNGQLIGSKKTTYSGDYLTTNELVMAKDDIGGGNIIGKVVKIPANGKYVLGDHVYKLTPKDVDKNFLFYVINSPKINRDFRKKANGTAQIGITNSTVTQQLVQIPIEEEQRKIAGFLRAIDDKIKAEEAKLAAAKKFKESLLQRMFV